MTYSIVARCPETAQLGVAVQSHFFSVGSVVPWLEAGVGAVATQAMAEVAHGPNGLARLRAGRSPADALADILAADERAETRQVAIVDAGGQAAVHTGSSCIREAGGIVGDGFTVQANMMERDGVPEAMADAFIATDGPLALRMLAALDAAEATGGDIRGKQSAALVVAFAQPTGKPGLDRATDVRVDDHGDPLAELRRLVLLNHAYRSMEAADDAMSSGDLDGALAIYAGSVAAQPQQPEFPFWQAIVLAGMGRGDEARAAAAPVFARPDGERWRELARRLSDAGLAPTEAIAALLA